jgi:hypothetical protein
MAVKKAPIEPDRIRRIPRGGFSWIDRKFIRTGHINPLPRESIALYFFLTAVADVNGMSFYADPTVMKLLKLRRRELLYARDCLLKADLIAYRYPLYQVLEMPAQVSYKPKQKQSPSIKPHYRHRKKGPEAIGTILDTVLSHLKQRK